MLLTTLFLAPSALAATGTSSTGDASVTITMDFLLTDSITLDVTGDVTGNTTLGQTETALDFGTVYYGAVGPLGTAGMAYPNLVEGNQYVIGKFLLNVTVTGLLGGADITASEGVSALYSDPANITAVITNVGALPQVWAVDGTTNVHDLQSNPALGTALNLLPTGFEAGFRIAQAAQPGSNSVPFVITATPI
ncbi:MAG: hypothetical protein H6738_21280 [Alphaproteobacteria bacterium]|nr:hypothetical protein [Alphaproteobacteria bacterium]MCB9699328.1 hypothetical protein [Alphaproteobacteria bacterium]